MKVKAMAGKISIDRERGAYRVAGTSSGGGETAARKLRAAITRTRIRDVQASVAETAS